MSRLTVFAGPNGSGKSTIRDLVPDSATVVDPDRLARAINPASPRSVDDQAGRMAVRLFDETLAAGKPISLETTLSGHSALRRMERAKAAGYDITLIYVALANADLNVERVAARVRMGGHAIEPDIVRRRVRDSMDNLPRAIAIADRAIVLDNSGAAHRGVLEVAGGRVTSMASDAPEWLRQRLPAIQSALQRASAARLGPTPVDPSAARASGDAQAAAVQTPQPASTTAQATPRATTSRVFDPFGDYETRGYLRNFAVEKDPGRIKRLEHAAISANVLPALAALSAARQIGYAELLDTHRTLFGSVYPWAGQDRSTLAPNIAIARGGVVDLFAHPADVRRAAEYGLEMARSPESMRARPGEVFGALAHAHPFLEGNGRTLLTVHADMAQRAGFHVAWQNIGKDAFLTALTEELRRPGRALDALIAPHVRQGPLPTAQAAADLKATPGFRVSGPSPSP